MINKEKILQDSKLQLAKVIDSAHQEQVHVKANIDRLSRRVKNFATPDGKVEAIILANNRERDRQLEQISGSPYFMRCDVDFANESKELYFGKFQMVEENIYSWVSPIAQLRFASMGEASYVLPKGVSRTGIVLRKDQLMIVDGKIIFLSSETHDYERTLIHQEHLQGKKNEFVLPEIIAQMEKAQDEVIRADYFGSFLIAGPAGSGKTTLAFHRIAYLTQSPDTAKQFPGYNIIVFVQDESTKQYFGAILPQLGIEEVTVTTYEEWALDILGLTGYKFVQRYGESEKIKDELEYYKNTALMSDNQESLSVSADIQLRTSYRPFLPKAYHEIFERQLMEKKLDRFDLTLLLLNKMEDGKLYANRRVVTEDKRGNLKMAVKKIALSYAFVVIDEAENYLAKQITVIKAGVNANKSVLYVGDLAQQTKYGTIKTWAEANENFLNTNKVILDKVYRNTKEILEYVRKEGYEVTIPERLKTGSVVVEERVFYGDLKDKIQEVQRQNKDVVIGVLYDSQYINKIEEFNGEFNDIKFLTFNEAQGVEFEVVILCKFPSTNNEWLDYAEDLKFEKEKMAHDLWYVALTRSMNKLIIFEIV